MSACSTTPLVNSPSSTVRNDVDVEENRDDTREFSPESSPAPARSPTISGVIMLDKDGNSIDASSIFNGGYEQLPLYRIDDKDLLDCSIFGIPSDYARFQIPSENARFHIPSETGINDLDQEAKDRIAFDLAAQVYRALSACDCAEKEAKDLLESKTAYIPCIESKYYLDFPVLPHIDFRSFELYVSRHKVRFVEYGPPQDYATILIRNVPPHVQASAIKASLLGLNYSSSGRRSSSLHIIGSIYELWQQVLKCDDGEPYVRLRHWVALLTLPTSVSRVGDHVQSTIFPNLARLPNHITCEGQVYDIVHLGQQCG